MDEIQGTNFYSEFDREKFGYNPLMTYLERTKLPPSCERIRDFVSDGCKIDAKSKHGKDAFCFVMAHPKSTIKNLETLVELGASIHTVTNEGWNAYSYVCYNFNPENEVQ